jgi:hypothetical protein
MRLRAALLPALLLAGAAAAQEAPKLRFPVDCRLGETCFIQNYVDRDPGPAARDFTCGPLTYHGHDGTDIALPTLAAMRIGRGVRAAAAGEVLRTRDGVPDVSIRATNAPDIADRECGNGVVLDHGNGWQTQYCHLRNGSIAVKRGQKVEAGQQLGLVGLSGKTEFPHLHMTLRRNGTVIDPFDGRPLSDACSTQPAKSLWEAPLAYEATGLIRAGFASETPQSERIENGDYIARVIAADAPILFYWVTSYGLREGDRYSFLIVGPDGRVRARTEPQVNDRDRARVIHYAGIRRPGEAFPRGIYRASYRIIRGEGAAEKVVVQSDAEVDVR